MSKGQRYPAESRELKDAVSGRRIRQITSRNGGRSLARVVEELRAYLLGWKAYFRLADTPGVFRDLDQWIARRLRMVQLKPLASHFRSIEP